jgi:hypothetical protein
VSKSKKGARGGSLVSPALIVEAIAAAAKGAVSA